ncbi:MAG: hypothetical protein WCK89_15430 [bacterium]
MRAEDYHTNRSAPQERPAKKYFLRFVHFALAPRAPFRLLYKYNERIVLSAGMENGCFPAAGQDFEGLKRVNSEST